MRAATVNARASSLAIVIWLALVCALIIGIVVVGGITRLTHSGLSIVEWKPVTGIVPPLTESEWQAEFLKYQQYPEYRNVNHGMNLAEFKSIFFWEYIHRLLGRLIGFAVLIPLGVFALRKKIDRALGLKLLGGVLLGGLQGVLGWYMVKSGLVDNPRVSHYRLAAHLSLALVVLSYLFWILLDLVRGERVKRDEEGASAGWVLALRGLTALVALQFVYGAFVAGLRAGFGFNTFPTMNGEWFPTGLFGMEPAWLSLFEGQIAVQFVHRWLGMAVLLGAAGFALLSRGVRLSQEQRVGVRILWVLVLLQVVLGIWALIAVVPLSIAVLHQFGACLVLLALVNLNHSIGLPAITPRRDRVAMITN